MKILKINKKDQKELVKLASSFIKKGKIIVFPTDTVYGIIYDATNQKAVKKIFRIKRRSPQKPFAVFVNNITTAKKLTKITKEQESFLKKVWPGKITLILKRKPFKMFGVKEKTIAMRIPNYGPLNMMLDKIQIPLVQTSANISGKNPLKSAKEIEKQFKNQKEKPDLIIDAGMLKTSKPSKIIDLTVSPPRILR